MVGLLMVQTDVWLERQPDALSCYFGMGPGFVGVGADSYREAARLLTALACSFSLTNTH